MENRSSRRNIFILLVCFILSRVIIKSLGISFVYKTIFEYWQYLDVESLEHNLLQSLWYQHSQPPVFNLLLGVVLKCSHSNAPLIFEILFLLISISNAYLLLNILEKIACGKYLPLVIALIYILSPATILFENELFYTSFTSFLLLSLITFLINFIHTPTTARGIGIFSALTLLGLTRSTYHLILLIFICGFLIFRFYRRKGSKLILLGSLISLGIVGGWYLKNYFVFDNFSSSSWLGINLSRIVFHDIRIGDSSTIASVHPGLPLSYYKKYIDDEYKIKYAGLNDRILLNEIKNESFINMNHAGFLEVSQKYLEASERYIFEKPYTYLGHAFTSLVIFFSPASSYFKVEENNSRMRYYDLVYSFNLSHFFKEKKKKRVALAISAIPLFLIYISVFGTVLRKALRNRFISTINFTIITIILFILLISTFFEYGENMRFRYELQPLFLILASQAMIIIRRKDHVEISK